MIYRSAAYLKWVRSQPCAVCGAKPCQAHHEPLGLAGMGIKCPDSHGMPLCHFCHDARHHYGAEWLEDRIDPKMTIIKLLTLYLSRGK